MSQPIEIEIEPSVIIETFTANGPDPAGPCVVAAHPSDAFTAETAALLARISGKRSVCINPRGVGGSRPDVASSIEQMTDDIERARQRLELGPIVFWGMSGGGWLAESYALRHPHALAGVIVESACACFRARLFDESCALSPRVVAWRDALGARGLVPDAIADAHAADNAEWIDVEGVGQVLRTRGGPALLVAPAPLSEAMKRALPAFFAFDARGTLAGVTLPALVIAGTADPIVPVTQVRAVHDALRNSRFVAIEGAGHVPSAQEHPDAVHACREFLAGL